MEISGQVVGKFVDWCNETEEPGKEGADSDGADAVPEKEHNDATPCDGAFFPSDFRMENISEDGGEGV